MLTSLPPKGKTPVTDERVAIVDFKLDSPTGPPASGRLPPEAVEKEMAQAGYRRIAAHDFLPNQYFLVFTPAS